MAQLYGAFDPLSLEWVDGVASTMFRNFVVDESPNRKWVSMTLLFKNGFCINFSKQKKNSSVNL